MTDYYAIAIWFSIGLLLGISLTLSFIQPPDKPDDDLD